MKRVLVAGATGYLGGYVVQEFKSRGYFVRALARSPKKLEKIRDSIDEIVKAEVTRPDTLEGVCDDIDIVFSSVGITKQRDGLTFKDVDYQGNKNLLSVAQRAGVEKFIYVSVFNGPRMRHLAIVRAHEDFVDLLVESGIDRAVIRPTGYFSDMSEYLKMAKKGRVYLIGNGANRINPIHGADLAVTCAQSAQLDSCEIDVGGPAALTHREIAELAFKSIGKKPRVSRVPIWLMRGVVSVTKIFSRHQGELLAFFTEAMTADAVAPMTGTRSLEAFFNEVGSGSRDP